jgi:hypothetical protein
LENWLIELPKQSERLRFDKSVVGSGVFTQDTLEPVGFHAEFWWA